MMKAKVPMNYQQFCNYQKFSHHSKRFCHAFSASHSLGIYIPLL